MKEITLKVRRDCPVLDGLGLSRIEELITSADNKSHGMDHTLDWLVKRQKSTDPGELSLTVNRAIELLNEISVLLGAARYILTLDAVTNTYDVLEAVNDKLKEDKQD